MPKISPPWMCPLCGKNLGKIAETLGDPVLVGWVHKHAHLREAAEAVLKAVEVVEPHRHPAIAKAFEDLQNALNL